MKFETTTSEIFTMHHVFVVGFHDSAFIDGEVFLNSKQAYEYCKNKVVYVKELSFRTEVQAEKFVNQMARGLVNHCRYGLDMEVNTDSIECDQYREEVIKVMNEQ
ncbi:hypothetical protein KKJFFJLC_00026 [Vibrio phage vB_VpaS_PGB]|nr:hypothetical protein HHKILHMN_00008 [Vibrio phage vB_VpaS_PGA]WVH05569.1 hypothetical protein KKJFFJLC_00026 [Vibrio phage vB_VpaS_PGB]